MNKKKSKRRSPKRKSWSPLQPQISSPPQKSGCGCSMSPSMSPLSKEQLGNFVNIYKNLKDSNIKGVTRQKWEDLKWLSLGDVDLTLEQINESIRNMEMNITNKNVEQKFCDLYSKNATRLNDAQKDYQLNCVRMKVLLMLEQMKLDKSHLLMLEQMKLDKSHKR